MQKRNLTILGVILIAVFVGTVSVRAVLPSAPNSSGTLHTTSVDIQILNVIPAIYYQPSGSNPTVATGVGLDVNEFPGISVNLTSAFSFAPTSGFVSVGKVLLTIVYFGGTGNYNGFEVSLNGLSPNIIPGTSIENTISGTLTSSSLKNGANTINVSLSLINPTILASTFIYQIRATVEYSYIA